MQVTIKLIRENHNFSFTLVEHMQVNEEKHNTGRLLLGAKAMFNGLGFYGLNHHIDTKSVKIVIIDCFTEKIIAAEFYHLIRGNI